MDRTTDQDGGDFEDRTIGIDLVFTAGTSGAVPTALTRSKGIKSVVLTSTEYLVTLQDNYVDLLNILATNVQATFAAAGAAYGVVTTMKVGKGGTSPNSVGVTFCKGSDGTAVVLAVGDTAHVYLRLKR